MRHLLENSFGWISWAQKRPEEKISTGKMKAFSNCQKARFSCKILEVAWCGAVVSVFPPSCPFWDGKLSENFQHLSDENRLGFLCGPIDPHYGMVAPDFKGKHSTPNGSKPLLPPSDQGFSDRVAASWFTNQLQNMFSDDLGFKIHKIHIRVAQIVGFRDSSLSSRLLHFEPHVPDVPVPLSTELPDGPPWSSAPTCQRSQIAFV